MDLVTTGDIAIASEQATFFDPHVSIGLVSGREMVRLARVLPLNVTMRLALMGKHERLSAQRVYELGLITDQSSDQYRVWYTHGVMHWIGIDVHDEGDYERKLEPGMAFVVEPGIYVRPQALDNLPDTPENRAFKAAVAPAVAKYKDIGIRLEDSFLLTAGGLKNLSAKVPKAIDDVERLLSEAQRSR